MWKKCISVMMGFAVFCVMWWLILYGSVYDEIHEATVENVEVKEVGNTYRQSQEIETVLPPTKIVDVDLSAPTQRWLFDVCEDYGVDFYVVVAMCEVESSFNADAVNDNGDCIGYMQLNPTYHSYGMDISAPNSNLLAGVKLMNKLLTHSGGDYVWSLKAYNGGGAYADSTQGTTDYVEMVLNRASELRGY